METQANNKLLQVCSPWQALSRRCVHAILKSVMQSKPAHRLERKQLTRGVRISKATAVAAAQGSSFFQGSCFFENSLDQEGRFLWLGMCLVNVHAHTEAWTEHQASQYS